CQKRITGYSALVTARAAPVFFFADFFQPLNRLPVQRFLNGDVRHRGLRRSAVPMLLVRHEPDNIARPDFLDRAAPSLRPPKAGCDDQRLTEWMSMPGGACARLKRDTGTDDVCGIGRLEQRINSDSTSKPIGWPSVRR